MKKSPRSWRPASRSAPGKLPTSSPLATRSVPTRRCETRHCRADRRDPLHRLHALHRGLPGGRDRRRASADAHRGRALVHRLRAVPAALPRRLHRHAPGQRRLERRPQGGGEATRTAAQAAPGAAGVRLAGEKSPLGDRRGAGAQEAMNPEKRREIFRRFQAANPNPTTELRYRTPYELLVAVVLSAQATDKSVNQASAVLFERFDTPDKMVKLGVAGLEKYIRRIGLHRTKAKNVVALSKILLEEHGGEVPASREALERLPGVGRKTANVVLNTAFGQPTVAVDTHIFRVANRTGLAPGKDPLEVEQRLLKFTPPEYLQNAHHWLILHGRYVCLARKPACPTCLIRDLCEFRPKTKLALLALVVETRLLAVEPCGQVFYV